MVVCAVGAVLAGLLSFGLDLADAYGRWVAPPPLPTPVEPNLAVYIPSGESSSAPTLREVWRDEAVQQGQPLALTATAAEGLTLYVLALRANGESVVEEFCEWSEMTTVGGCRRLWVPRDTRAYTVLLVAKSTRFSTAERESLQRELNAIRQPLLVTRRHLIVWRGGVAREREFGDSAAFGHMGKEPPPGARPERSWTDSVIETLERFKDVRFTGLTMSVYEAWDPSK